jgi:hypothetical protein
MKTTQTNRAFDDNGKTWNKATLIGEGLYGVALDRDENVVIIAPAVGGIYEALATLGRSEAAYRDALTVADRLDREEISETESAIVAAYNALVESRWN